MNNYQLAEESRDITCTVQCNNCDFIRHCEYCGDDICGLYTNYGHDIASDVICEDCKEINQ